MTRIKYPDIQLKLTGEDGNAFFILGRCKAAMKNGGLSQPEMELFYQEATAGDYDHLLRTCMAWFDCC